MRLFTIALSAAVIAFGAGPTLARTSDAGKPAVEAQPAPCHAYEQNPDGSWKEMACAENGLTPPAPAKISTRNEGKAALKTLR